MRPPIFRDLEWDLYLWSNSSLFHATNRQTINTTPAQLTSAMVVDDIIAAFDCVAFSTVGKMVGIEEGAPTGGTGADVGADTGRGVVGAFVGRREGCAVVVGGFVGAGEGFRVSTSFVTEATVRPGTPSEALAAASKALPVSDDSTSLEYASDETKLVTESETTTENDTDHV